MSAPRNVKRVHVVADTTCQHTSFGETKAATLHAGWVLGNVLGHHQGVDVLERPDGLTLSMWVHGIGNERWAGVAPESVTLEP